MKERSDSNAITRLLPLDCVQESPFRTTWMRCTDSLVIFEVLTDKDAIAQNFRLL